MVSIEQTVKVLSKSTITSSAQLQPEQVTSGVRSAGKAQAAGGVQVISSEKSKLIISPSEAQAVPVSVKQLELSAAKTSTTGVPQDVPSVIILILNDSG